MQTKPEINKPYVFVRARDDRLEFTVFTLFRDGSCSFRTDCADLSEGTFFEHTFEFNPDGWKNAIRRLDELGFVELEEAKRQGLVPLDTNPDRRTRKEVAAIEELMRPGERPEWISETGIVDPTLFYRAMKREGWKEQSIWRSLKYLHGAKQQCNLNYKEFKAIVAAEKRTGRGDGDA